MASWPVSTDSSPCGSPVCPFAEPFPVGVRVCRYSAIYKSEPSADMEQRSDNLIKTIRMTIFRW
eukprot:gene103-56_t